MTNDKVPTVADDTEKRFKMKIDVNITQTGKGEFMDQSLVYSNLGYEDVVMIEGLLVDVLAKLNQFAQTKV